MISLGHQPYFGMSNGEVLNHVTSGGKLYDRPQNCPDDLLVKKIFHNLIDLINFDCLI